MQRQSIFLSFLLCSCFLSLAFALHPTSPSGSRMNPEPGMWGPVDANVNWCEADYAITPWIAEFWNTISSIGLIGVGIFGFVVTPRTACAYRRYQYAYLAFCFVGIGSMLFHMTLRAWAQSLDELPMILADMFLLYMIAEDESDGRYQKYPWLGPILALYFAIGCFLYFALPQHYIVFLLLYGVPVGTMTIAGGYLATRPSARRSTRIAFVLAFVFYFGGFGLWVMDNVFCAHVQSFQLHALWHIFAGIGTHLYILFTLLHLLSHLNVPAELAISVKSILPFVDAHGIAMRCPDTGDLKVVPRYPTCFESTKLLCKTSDSTKEKEH